MIRTRDTELDPAAEEATYRDNVARLVSIHQAIEDAEQILKAFTAQVEAYGE